MQSYVSPVMTSVQHDFSHTLGYLYLKILGVHLAKLGGLQG